MLLSLVATSFTQYPELRVVQAPTWENACRRLEEGEPDVLIFDLRDGCERRILPLLFEHPGLLMIGLDVEANQAVLVSGQETRSRSLPALPGDEVLDQPLNGPLAPDQTKGSTTVIFDLEAIQPGFLLSLLQQPRMLLTGIDPETHEALVWFGRQAPAVSAADLIAIIQQKESNFNRFKGEIK